MKNSTRLVALCTVALCLACSDDATGDGPTGSSDVVEDQAGTGEADAAGGGAETGETTDFMEGCVEGDDCSSGQCIHANETDGVCTIPCRTDDDCGDEMICQTMVDPTGSRLDLCYPEETALCDDCSDGCGQGECLELSDGERCSIPCEEGLLCPQGFECVTLDVGDADVVRVCQPFSGTCAECDGADLGFDVDNCGVCGNVCSVDNGTADCVRGRCTVGGCSDGYRDCDFAPSNGCEVDLADPSHCGGCAALAGVPGEACGVCGSGHWACNGTEEVVCVEEVPGSQNTCGGCSSLLFEPTTECSRGCGTYQCNGPDAVECVTDAESTPSACGACVTLAAAPGDACGTCGAFVCNDGGTLDCDDPGANTCGGCDTLVPALGTPCGACLTDEFICDPSAVNEPMCSGNTTNDCGGCADLPGVKDADCGTCDTGTWACLSDNLMECDGDVGDAAMNQCGGCTPIAVDIGERCGRCLWSVWACDGEEDALCFERPIPTLTVESVPTLFPGEATEHTLSAGVVYLAEADIIVPVGHTLTLEPGVIIKFSAASRHGPDYSLVVEGTLLAQGTEGQPIVVTSSRDDCIAGDSNQDGAATDPVGGNWGAVELVNSPTSRLAHFELYYGGGGNATDSPTEMATDGALIIRGDAPRIDGEGSALDELTVAFSQSRGLYVDVSGLGFGWEITSSHFIENGIDGDPRNRNYDEARGAQIIGGSGNITIVDSTFVGNGTDGLAVDTEGWLTLNRLEVHGNGSGLDLSSTGPLVLQSSEIWDHAEGFGLTVRRASVDDNVIRNNTIRSDGALPMDEREVLARVAPGVVSDLMDGNALEWGQRGIFVFGGDIEADGVWPDRGMTYVLLDDMGVAAGATLTIEAGVVIKPAQVGFVSSDDSGILVNGVLNMDGTPDDPIVITSFRDDSVGGDTNIDGVASDPSAGDWTIVRFEGDAGGRLRHVELRWGGGRPNLGGGVSEAVVDVQSVRIPELTSVTVLDSLGGGFLLKPTGAFGGAVTDLTFERGGNSKDCFRLDGGDGTFTLDGIDISGCAGDGIFLGTPGAVTLTNAFVDEVARDGMYIRRGTGSAEALIDNAGAWGLRLHGTACAGWDISGVSFGTVGDGEVVGCD